MNDSNNSKKKKKTFKVLVACEYSGTVRDAFNKHSGGKVDAMSCDLLPTESEGPHYQGDMFDLPFEKYDLVVAHPPCTAVCVSGNGTYANTQERIDGAKFIEKIWKHPGIKRLCIENPVGVLNTFIPELPRPQYVQPWQFGHGETKKTGLWLRDVPPLVPTDIVDGREPKVHLMSPSPDRWKARSKTYTGIAHAMAIQWTKHLVTEEDDDDEEKDNQ